MREIPQGKSSPHSKPKAKAENTQEAVHPMDISKTNGKQKEYEDRYKEQREKLKQEKLKTLKKSGIPLNEYKMIEKNYPA